MKIALCVKSVYFQEENKGIFFFSLLSLSSNHKIFQLSAEDFSTCISTEKLITNLRISDLFLLL